MLDDVTLPVLMWLGVGVGYAWSVWMLQRLWHHVPPERSLRGESKVVYLNGRSRSQAGRLAAKERNLAIRG